MAGEYYHTEESVEEYIKLAEGVNGGELIQKLKKYLPSKSTVLELGSGPGTDFRILSDTYSVVGSDNSKEFLNHLVTQNPDSLFLELDAVTLSTAKKFDGLYSNKVLHHLKDDELLDSIKRQYELLNEGGVICHSFWKGEGSEVFKGMFVNYHTEGTLKGYFEEYFDLLVVESYMEFEEGDSVLLIGRKK